MFNKKKQLILDIKAQDRLRQWLADRSNQNNFIITKLALGDSDIDYEMSYRSTNIRVLNAPFNVADIRYKLIFEGGLSSFGGKIATHARYIDSNGEVLSLYNYPGSNSLVLGTQIPSAFNGYDWQEIIFSNLTKEGFFLFNETLPLNYFTSTLSTIGSFSSFDYINAQTINGTTYTGVHSLTSHNLKIGDQVKLVIYSGDSKYSGIHTVVHTSASDGSLANTMFVIDVPTQISTIGGIGEWIKSVTIDEVPQRFPETYTIANDALPTHWEILPDPDNGSLFICHSTLGSNPGTLASIYITVTGNLSRITKRIKVTFNY
jgi:hypothetical protein